MRALVVLLLISLVPASLAQEPAAQEGTMLHLIEYSYVPDPLNVTPGETIVVMNFGPADQSLPRDQWGEFTHTVTAVDGSFDMQNIPPDFVGRNLTAPSAPGTYPYYCRYHGDASSGMRGTLIVTAPPPSAPPTQPGGSEKEAPLGLLPLAAAALAAVLLFRRR